MFPVLIPGQSPPFLLSYFVLLSLLLATAAQPPTLDLNRDITFARPKNSTLTFHPDPRFQVRSAHWGPKLRVTSCLINAVHAMTTMALLGYHSGMGETVYSEAGVAIAVLPKGWQTGGEMERRFAVWGLYYGIYDMNKFDNYRCSTLHLLWAEEELGTIGFSKGVVRRPADDQGLLNMNGNISAVDSSLSVTTTPVMSLYVDFLETIIPINVVFITVIGALADLAIAADVDTPVATLVFDQAPVPAYLSFEPFSLEPRRGPPFLTYRHVIETLGQLPNFMLEKRTFAEADILVKLDGTVVGLGLLRKLHTIAQEVPNVTDS